MKNITYMEYLRLWHGLCFINEVWIKHPINSDHSVVGVFLDDSHQSGFQEAYHESQNRWKVQLFAIQLSSRGGKKIIGSIAEVSPHSI